MSDATANKNYDSTQGSNGSSTGRKIRGATEVVHGIGENIRGRFMDALDTSTNTGPKHPETEKGRIEVEQGMAKLTGGPGVEGGAPHSVSPSQPMRAGDAPHSTSSQPQLAPEGTRNTLGPTSAMTAGFGNAGPETAVAEAPYQQQYSAGGSGTTTLENENENGRDFGYAQRSQSAGVGQEGNAPDRYALGGEGPRQLP